MIPLGWVKRLRRLHRRHNWLRKSLRRIQLRDRLFRLSPLLLPLMVGGTVRMVSKYDPAATARAIAEEGVTCLLYTSDAADD